MSGADHYQRAVREGSPWPCLYPLRPCPAVERAPWTYVPATTITEARASDAARARLDREYAKAAGLSADEVGPFLRALASFDANTPAWEEKQALERARAYRVERLRIEGLGREWEGEETG